LPGLRWGQKRYGARNATSTHTEEKMKNGDEFWKAWALAAQSARGVNCVNLIVFDVVVVKYTKDWLSDEEEEVD
jgi:hypothetical protein